MLYLNVYLRHSRSISAIRSVGLTSKPVVGVGRFTSPDLMVRQVRAGTIAAAVWSGRRYAEEFGAVLPPDDQVPFRREVTALAARPSGGLAV